MAGKRRDRKKSPEESKNHDGSFSETASDLDYKGEIYGETPMYIGIGPWSPQDTEEEDEVVYKALKPLESAAIVALFEDAIDELTILKYVIGAPNVVSDFHYKTLRERYTRKMTADRLFPEIDNKPPLTTEIKLQRERELIEIVMHRTIMSLVDDGAFYPLTKALESMEKEEEDDLQMMQELKKNLWYIKDLKKRVEEKRRLDDLEEKERDEFKYQLQDEMDDTILKCKVEEAFVDKWENTRNAQNQWKLRNAENAYKDNIGKINMKIKMERKATHEIQMFLKNNQTELEDQLEDWMARYDSEMERRENKIIHLKYDAEQAHERKEMLQQTYEDKMAEVKEWVAFMNERSKKIWASLQIQSWWRGIMVRKKLGPYKQKKAKGGKKKK